MATNKSRYTYPWIMSYSKQIADFCFEQHFQTRPEATMELIRLGLKKHKEQEEMDRTS